MDINQIGIDVDAPLSVSFNFRKKRKLQQCSKHKKMLQTKPKRNAQDANSIVALDDSEPFGDIVGDRLQRPEASPQESIPLPLEEEEEDATEGPPGISVSFFDHSAKNHLKSLRTMFKLCGEHDTPDFNQAEIQHLSSITFLKEWRDFNYKPKTIRFACQNESMNSKNVIGEISLPQFSSVAVPEPEDLHNEKSISSQASKDFVAYAGGSVWALDWCPRANNQSVSGMKMEFVAVASHPPGSSYHKIGSALTGRGIIQIWCILDVSSEETNSSQDQKKQKRCYRKPQTDKSNSAAPKRPRGRPRKHKANDSSDNNMKSGGQVVDPPTTECLKDSSLVPVEISLKDTHEGESLKKSEDVPAHVQKKQNCVGQKGQTNGLNSSATTKTGGRRRLKAGNEAPDNVNNGSPLVDPDAIQYPEIVSSSLTINVAPICNDGVIDAETEIAPSQVEKHQKGIDKKSKTESDSISCRDVSTLSNYTPKDHVPLPKMMLCLAHNGKVVWDLKWQPSDSHDKLRLGYLAVVLGNGSIEVWEVPCPYAVQVIYSSSSQLECTDPRFMKLQPVFRCSKLNCGDKQSIPLTVEWSTSSPHDMVIAGCHDGMVALWKFSAAVSCEETKPLLCFSADTVPIRTLSWAPAESNCEASNVIVTGGSNGLKFWDIRDPFHPLWDVNPVQRNILSLDWLPDPRCIVVSFDDGTLRVLSLMKAANDFPVTEKPFTGTLQQGFSSYFCSSFAIWDVHVSRKTGIVAYCGVDGNTLHFQLTTKAVERDRLRSRNPHFLCGSLMEEESEFTVVTRQYDIPYPMKKSLNEWSDAPRTKRGFLFVSNQEKRANEEMEKNKLSDQPPLALCYGNDPRDKFDTDPLVSGKTKHAHNSATRRSSKADERGLTCINENPEMSQNATAEQKHVDDIDSFPPKSIAIHRVRWNMNKGSERWLCYGGAAGIIRLQKVDTSIS